MKTKTSNRYPKYGTHRTSLTINETVHCVEVNHDELITIILNSIRKDNPDLPSPPTSRVNLMEDFWGSICAVVTWVEKHGNSK